MSNKIYFIGDTHFSHKNIIKFEGTKAARAFDTLEEHDEELIDRWNSRVNQRDTVWHLGDFCFGGKQNVAIAGRLNGYKKLVLGNHDHYPTEEYLKYFHKVYGIVEFRGGVLSHAPLHTSQLEHRFKFNIHGHLHHQNIDDERYINVSCEQINLTPISFDELLNNTTKGMRV